MVQLERFDQVFELRDAAMADVIAAAVRIARVVIERRSSVLAFPRRDGRCLEVFAVMAGAVATDHAAGYFGFRFAFGFKYHFTAGARDDRWFSTIDPQVSIGVRLNQADNRGRGCLDGAASGAT